MALSNEEIAALAQKHYGLSVSVMPLPGYEEWNYLLNYQEDKKFILKITGAADPSGLAEAQAKMVAHLIHKGMNGVFPEHLLNKEGKAITLLFRDNAPLCLRIMRYIDGTLLADSKDHSPALLENFGRFLGEMDAALSDFDCAAAHRYHTWDIQNALDSGKHLHLIASHEDRRIVHYFLLQFEMEVGPHISSLRQAVIHNDANDRNVLTQGDHISGLIDFGDMVYAPVVNNIAIALTYIMLDKEDPITAAASMVRGYHSENLLTEKEVGLLYYLIASRLCISVIRSAYYHSVQSANAHHFVTEKRAWKLLHRFIRINPLKAQQAFRLACGMKPLYKEGEDHAALLLEREKYIGKNLSISYREKLKIVRGALQYLYDDQGRTYLDCVNNVSHVGHCHPAVVKAMQRQTAMLNTNTRYLHDELEEYAKLLCDTLPGELSVCYFTNSGSEANDLAVRMARHFTGQKDVIVLDYAYHGTSTLAIEMSPYKFDGKSGFAQPTYIHKAVNPDLYRGPFRYGDQDAGRKYAESVKSIIAKLSRENKKPAVFICETLLGVGGQIPLPPGYLETVYQYVRAAGGLCIADEVQVGFGRVGSAFWGFELQNVIPDMVVMGKPIGNGHPLAAVVTTREIADAFNNGMEYFNTFGGNPVSMATGKAVLNVIKNEELQQNALLTGRYLLKGLQGLKNNYPLIGDVRGEGLFIGVEFIKDSVSLEPALDEVNETVERMKDRGFLLSTDGPLHNVLKIKPPIIFSHDNADDLVRNLEEVLTQIS